METKNPSIGIFFARPDRSYFMAKKLAELGLEVVHYNTQAHNGDPYVEVQNGVGSAIARLLLRTHHDVYFTSLSFIPSLSLYMNRLLRGKRYVFNATGVKWEMFKDRSRRKPFAGFFQYRFYPFLLERVFAGASKIVCNSRFLESTLAAHYPQYRGRLMTIYNGIDLERYAQGQRQELPGVRPGDFVLLCVTALNFENKSRGLDLVLEAFDAVRAQRPEAKLVIAAKTADSLYQQQAEAHLRSFRWRDAVILFYNHPNIPDLLASSDLFVYATPHNSNDSLPRALLEAQAAGLPAVTTNTTGCPEIVADGQTGWVVPYEPAPMAEKIVQLMEAPDLRRRMGREAKQRIPQIFNWDQMAKQYAAVFLEVAGQAQTKMKENFQMTTERD